MHELRWEAWEQRRSVRLKPRHYCAASPSDRTLLRKREKRPRRRLTRSVISAAQPGTRETWPVCSSNVLWKERSVISSKKAARKRLKPSRKLREKREKSEIQPNSSNSCCARAIVGFSDGCP